MNLEAARDEPWRFDFFAVLRALERRCARRPRIGDAASTREDYARLGQDPYMAFPASTLSRFSPREDGGGEVRVNFLGLLGPQGALPLATTEEAYGWLLAQDDAFPRFLDLINHRFLQLFYRAWADARPIAQHDRPDEDRFEAYIGSACGLGSEIFRDLDAVPDRARLGYSGLLGPAARSAARLRGVIRGLFQVDAEIDEFVGSRLPIEACDQSRLGQARLGVDALVGASFFSVQDKIRVRVFVEDMAAYRRFLPQGEFCEKFADLLFFYIGDELDCDLELAIPAKEVEPVRLGRSGALGWTSWVSPDWTKAGGMRADARFNPAERMRQARARAASAR